MAQNFGTSSGSTSGGKKEESKADSGDAGQANANGSGEGAGEQGKGQGMNPIDQLVILKLYRQLTELLKTVEGLEDAA